MVQGKIVTVHKYEDAATPRVIEAFQKQSAATKAHSQDFEKMRKSIQRSMSRSRKEMRESMNNIAMSMRKVSTQTKSTAKEFGRMRIATAGLREKMGALRNNLLLVFFAYRMIIVPLKETIILYQRQQDAIKRLNVALELQGTYTKYSSKRLQEMASAFQEVTRYGDEAVMEVMQQLVSVGRVLPSQLKRATTATLDFAAATGRDLRAATLVVAKAMTGYTGELSRYGIKIQEGLSATEKAAATLEFMNKQFGGHAQKDIETYLGKWDQMVNSFNDARESVGRLSIRWGKLNEVVVFWNELFRKGKKFMDRDLGAAAERRVKNINDEIQKYKLLIRVYKEAYAISGEESIKKEGQAYVRLHNLKVKQLKTALGLQKQERIQAELKADELDKVAQKEKDLAIVREQMGKSWTTATKSAAMASRKAMEDLFFNVIHLRFRQMEDVVVAFGQTILKTLLRVAANAAMVKMGFGSLVGLGGHTGLYVRHGMRSSSGTGPREQSRRKFHTGGEVSATLLAGEGVLNKRAMQNLGVNNLNRLNRGEGMGGGETTNNYYIQTIDERSFVERLSQHPEVYSGAIGNDLSGNNPIRRSIQRYGR